MFKDHIRTSSNVTEKKSVCSSQPNPYGYTHTNYIKKKKSREKKLHVRTIDQNP